MKEYFIIHCDDDGDISVDNVDKTELIEHITPDLDAGDDNYYGAEGFFKEVPEDLQTAGNKLLIIKGKVVVPDEKEVVKSFDVE